MLAGNCTERRKTVECLHFDLDSVLYIPSAFLENALRRCIVVMIEHGLEATFDEAMARLLAIREADANAVDHFDRLCHYFNKCHDPIVIAAGVEKYWDCKLGVMMPAPHTDAVLKLLAQQYPLTIISNGLPVKQAGKLIRIGLSHYFIHRNAGRHGVHKGYFFATADPAKQKPNPYLWQQARKNIHFEFRRSIMIGDRYGTDMLGAKRLAMITVKVNQGKHQEETMTQACRQLLQSEQPAAWLAELNEAQMMELMQPDYTIDSLAQLPAVIKEAGKKIFG